MEKILSQLEIQLLGKNKLKRIIVRPGMYSFEPSRSYVIYIPHKYCADTDTIKY